jgi:uncharacterized protein YndB with AHSA1/START domain
VIHAPAPLQLALDRTLDAPPERVFRAWTEPAELAHWFCPTPGVPTTADVDLRVGGAYRIHMGTYEVAGAYRTVDPPHALTFTWGWASGGDSPRMLVTVTFEPVEGGGTRLRLRHERFAVEAERASHQSGWTRSLARLDGALGGGADGHA